ncbi:MAG TPA: hypothetical protein VJP76_06290, partial [Candidatus Tumulicola sp.]|nr:hypothetical protein [Candidatus Tumulicola sp.]
MNARVSGWAVALAMTAAATAPAGAAPQTFSLAAMNGIVQLSDAAISPDGARIAFVSETAVLDDNSYRDRLWAYDLRAGRLRLIGAPRASYATPTWSPDGRRLAVVASDPATHADQLFVVPAAGGALHRVTAGKSDVVDFAWRPDGRAIAFVRRDDPRVLRGAAAYDDAFEVTDNDYLATEAARPRRLWLADLQTGRDRLLTHGTWSVADDAISWTPDGRELSYMRVPSAVHGIADRSAAYALDAVSLTSRPLTPHAAYEDQALFSPVGSRVLYLYPRDGDYPNALTAMTVSSAASADDRDETRALDRHVETAGWMPGGRSLLLKIYDTASSPLYVQPLDGPARALPMGDVADAQIGTAQSVARDGTVAFVGTQRSRPNELYVLPRGADRPQRLTDFNAA